MLVVFLHLNWKLCDIVCETEEQESYRYAAKKVSEEIYDGPKRMDVSQTPFFMDWIKCFSKWKELCSEN